MGLEGHIANFAHNLSGWHVSKETIAHIDDDSEEGRRARDLYDVPAMPGKFNKDTLEDLHDGARMWYAHQNMAVLCALSNTLTWEPMRFEKFSLARVRRPPLRTGAINPWPMDAVYREIGRRWMNLEFNTGNRVRDPNHNVFGTDRVRTLVGSRLAPSVEAAWMRSERRRRNRRRRERERVRAVASGLGNNFPGVAQKEDEEADGGVVTKGEFQGVSMSGM